MRTGEGTPKQLQDIKYEIVQYTRGVGVELGRGSYKAFPHFIGVRERSDTEMLPTVAPDVPCDTFEQGLEIIKNGSLDFVFAWGGITLPRDQIIRVLKVGGLFIDCSTELTRDVYKKPEPDNMNDLLWLDTLPGCFRPEKTACVVRYGAIGDTLQSAAILPELKRQGYHVTWMCEPRGQELLANDPNIDAFFVQDKDQVPNLELPAFWAVQRKRFDRFINLCESVEGTLIKLPGRADFHFPHAVRNEMCAHNYLEFTAKLAELPFHPEHHFHESVEEELEARQYIARIRDQQNAGLVLGERTVRPFVIMWCLSGSSTHKSYPHADAVIARILQEMPSAHIVFTGDYACQILETGWENEPRVHRESGTLPVRKTLALAKQCDLVIGPETGVLNAVAFESMPKLVFLSHSSHENLTRDWRNTEPLTSAVTPCYPCHRLHYTDEFCPRHPESRGAMCQHEIEPAAVWEAVKRAFTGRETVNRILLP